jgi:hypothetical protein
LMFVHIAAQVRVSHQFQHHRSDLQNHHADRVA